jgi:hypothetical protein
MMGRLAGGRRLIEKKSRREPSQQLFGTLTSNTSGVRNTQEPFLGTVAMVCRIRLAIL